METFGNRFPYISYILGFSSVSSFGNFWKLSSERERRGVDHQTIYKIHSRMYFIIKVIFFKNYFLLFTLLTNLYFIITRKNEFSLNILFPIK